jgi:uncharacterized protein involved in exopolysaccharide biosynthesis
VTTPRKYPLPIRIRPEPETREEILTEIDELQHHSRGSARRIADWIQRRITELQERLEKLK